MIRSSAPAVIAIAFLLAAQPSLPAVSKQSKHPKRKTASKRDTTEEEQHLRIRLQVSPNDRPAYEKLLRLLNDRYAFRAQAQLDAQWLQNNPDDYSALVDLTSAATAALNDPELAIEARRTYLNNVQRDPSDTTFDFVMSGLASELSKRGRSEDALRLSDQLLDWTSDDAGCGPTERQFSFTSAELRTLLHPFATLSSLTLVARACTSNLEICCSFPATSTTRYRSIAPQYLHTRPSTRPVKQAIPLQA